MSQEMVRRLFDHMWRADGLVLETLTSRAGTPPRAVDLYAHVVAAELVWIDRVEQRPQTVQVWPAADLAQCRAMAEQSRARYQSLLSKLPPDGLFGSIHYTNSAGNEFDTRLDDILLHVALHGAYHRGQIAMLLRDSGCAPASSDFILFTRDVPAAGGSRT
ncbi:MAG: DinB family protein [Candidatus Hydrogenedentales bacterium]